MDILDLLSGKLENQNVINELSKSTGADSNKVQDCIKLGIPTLMQAMKNNTNSPEGAASLAKALDKHKDANVDDIEGFLNTVDMKDGRKILGHILGNNNIKVQNNLSKQTGLEDHQVSGILSKLAPLLMGMLGKQKSSTGSNANDLSSMLMGLLGGSGASIMSTVTKLLDGDGDGNIIDDIGKMAGDFFNKKDN